MKNQPRNTQAQPNSDPDYAWKAIQGLGSSGIAEHVTDFAQGFANEPYPVKRVLVPEGFQKNHMVAGKTGIIIPLAGYNYYQVDYELDGPKKDQARIDQYWEVPVDHLPGWAQPFEGLRLFGVSREFKVFATDDGIRWINPDGRLSGSYKNPLSGKNGIMHLDGICSRGLICISSTTGSLLLFSIEYRTHQVWTDRRPQESGHQSERKLFGIFGF